MQLSGVPLHGLNCQKLASVPEGVSIPPEFNANSVTDCQQSLLGLPTARTLRVSRIARDGALTKVAQIRQRLGADGKPTPGLPLDIFVLPLLIALRFALDRIGGSIGRRICRLGLSNVSDGQYPPPTTSLSWRYAAQAGAAAGAGLDLVGLCVTVSRPGVARHHAVLAVLGRDRHSLADCSPPAADLIIRRRWTPSTIASRARACCASTGKTPSLRWSPPRRCRPPP